MKEAIESTWKRDNEDNECFATVFFAQNHQESSRDKRQQDYFFVRFDNDTNVFPVV